MEKENKTSDSTRLLVTGSDKSRQGGNGEMSTLTQRAEDGSSQGTPVSSAFSGRRRLGALGWCWTVVSGSLHPAEPSWAFQEGTSFGEHFKSLSEQLSESRMKNLGKPGKREQTRDQGSPPRIRLQTKGPQRHSRVEKNNWMQLSPGTGCECWGRPVMAEDTVQGPPSACQVSGLRFKLTSTGGTPLPKFTRPRVSTLCICNYPIWGRLSKLRFLSPSRIFLKRVF